MPPTKIRIAGEAIATAPKTESAQEITYDQGYAGSSTACEELN